MKAVKWDYTGKLDTGKNSKTFIEYICSAASICLFKNITDNDFDHSCAALSL